MSNSADRQVDPDSLEAFAPMRIRDAARHSNENVVVFASSMSDDVVRPRFPNQASDERRIVAETSPLPTTPETTRIDAPESGSGPGGLRRHWRSMLMAATALALLVAGAELVRRTSLAEKSEQRAVLLSPLTKKSVQDEKQTKLVVHQSAPRRMGQAVPLGVSAPGRKDGGLVVVRGLPTAAKLSRGSFVSGNDWWVSAMELDGVEIQPAPKFTGPMEIAVELRAADMGLIDQRVLRFEWAAVAEQEANKSVSEVALPKDHAIRRISVDEMAALLKRGRDLIASGDLAAGRSVLQRAAEAGSAQAAFLIAGTYDPDSLSKLQVHGVVSDIAMARYWYEKADELGSQEAPGRLKILAKQ